MRYLITGTPRSRTAWLSAVMTAHGSPCYHDVLVYQIPLDVDAGVADPAIACIAPEAAANNRGPLVFLYRPDWQESFEQWSNTRLADATIRIWRHNLDLMMGRADVVLAPKDLDRTAIVAGLVEQCTQLPPNLQTIELMQRLRIEQHQQKAHHSYHSHSPSPRITSGQP